MPRWTPDEPAFEPWQPERQAAKGWRALLHQGENPIQWALPLGSIAGIRIRVGLLFILFLTFQLVAAAGRDELGPAAMMAGSLFVIILLHEFGHCFACRWVKGEADDILMWPLGGLASCRPPHNWKASIITTIGGPAVNVALVPVLAAAIYATGGTTQAVIFNPFNYGGAWSSYVDTWWRSLIWWSYFTNWVLLGFNVLLPMFPMDGGRIWQALIWRKSGYRRSMEISCTVGLATALVLGVLAMVLQQMNMFAIAAFGGITCWSERQRLRFMGEAERFGQEEESPYAASLRLVTDDEDDDITAPPRRTPPKDDPVTKESAEVDRILLKIARTGMDSLTAKERKMLQQETNRRRIQ